MNRAMVYGPCARLTLPQGDFTFHRVVEPLHRQLPRFHVTDSNRLVSGRLAA